MATHEIRKGSKDYYEKTAVLGEGQVSGENGYSWEHMNSKNCLALISTHTLSLYHTHTHSLSLTHTLTHSHTLSLSLSHSLTLSLSHSLTHSLTHTHTHSLSFSFILSPSSPPPLPHPLPPPPYTYAYTSMELCLWRSTRTARKRMRSKRFGMKGCHVSGVEEHTRRHKRALIMLIAYGFTD